MPKITVRASELSYFALSRRQSDDRQAGLFRRDACDADGAAERVQMGINRRQAEIDPWTAPGVTAQTVALCGSGRWMWTLLFDTIESY